MLRKLASIEDAYAIHPADAAVGIAIVIRPEVADLDAYDEGRLAKRTSSSIRLPRTDHPTCVDKHRADDQIRPCRPCGTVKPVTLP
jgi:hypothetical protein